MTPTPEQLADVLPRCAAGLDGGNWTKADARLAWATKVLAWVEEATPTVVCIKCYEPITIDQQAVSHFIDEWEHAPRCPRMLRYTVKPSAGNRYRPPETVPESPESDETAREVSQDPGNGSGRRSAHVVLDGDTWQVRDGLATIVGSNDWPSPAKDTHESQLVDAGRIEEGGEALPGEDPLDGRGGFHEFCAAETWSRTPSPPAPGITYHDAEEAR